MLKKFEHTNLYYAILTRLVPSVKKALHSERKLFTSVFSTFPRPFLVFDLGANVGHSCKLFLDAGAEVVCVEPSSKNIQILTKRFAENPRVNILPKAISDQKAIVSLYLQDNGNSLHTLNTKWKSFLESPDNDRRQNPIFFSNEEVVETITLRSLIEKYGSPHFIKIDVEGHEDKVLKTLDRPVPMLSFEANLPQFLEETLCCLDKINQLSPTARFNYSRGGILVLKESLPFKQFRNFIQTTTSRYLDVFCWMENI